jgi:hypothetical protein
MSRRNKKVMDHWIQELIDKEVTFYFFNCGTQFLKPGLPPHLPTILIKRKIIGTNKMA